jgi:hypothetical protein
MHYRRLETGDGVTRRMSVKSSSTSDYGTIGRHLSVTDLVVRREVRGRYAATSFGSSTSTIVPDAAPPRRTPGERCEHDTGGRFPDGAPRRILFDTDSTHQRGIA